MLGPLAAATVGPLTSAFSAIAVIGAMTVDRSNRRVRRMMVLFTFGLGGVRPLPVGSGGDLGR